MCGIVGFNWPDRKLVTQVSGLMKHRGPDGEGVYVDRLVSLGHRRLAVVDLSERGAQPMRWREWVIVYNGEVYNYEEIGDELKRKGYTFRSDSDTEVVLKAYVEWGGKCVKRFNGMWAVGIYNLVRRELFLSRDRWGIKPLYYWKSKKRFGFASEASVLAEIAGKWAWDERGVNSYFYQKYIGGELSVYRGMKKLGAGENMVVEIEKARVRKWKYYWLEREVKKWMKVAVEDRLERIREVMEDAVEVRLKADVPVGCFLSGGIDSSWVSGVAKRKVRRLKTFSVGFGRESYDETKYARRVAEWLKVEHESVVMDESDEAIWEVVGKMDEPLGDGSAVPLYQLARRCREDVVVMISGDGGDEVFGGYETYRAGLVFGGWQKELVQRVGKWWVRGGYSKEKLGWKFKVARLVERIEGDRGWQHLEWLASVVDGERRKLLGERFVGRERLVEVGEVGEVRDLQRLDIETYLVGDVLKKVDAVSMAWGLEVRVPMLDYRLVPVVLSLPDWYRVRWSGGKWLLKEMARGVVPDWVGARKKSGLSVPLYDWVGRKGLMEEAIFGGEYYEHGWLDKVAVERMWVEHRDGRVDRARELWLVTVFNLWAKENGV